MDLHLLFQLFKVSLLLLDLVSEATQMLLVDLPVVLHLLLECSLQNTQ